MEKAGDKKPIHQKAYHHVRRHKKNYVRFLSFFLFLVVYSIIEDLIAITLHGVSFDIATLINVIIIAVFFTIISEVTEGFYKKEEPKLEKFIIKEGKMIQCEERSIKKRLKKL